jgi:hypothetical protein
MKTCSLISYAPRRVRVAAVSRYRANDRFFICRPSRAVEIDQLFIGETVKLRFAGVGPGNTERSDITQSTHP